MSTIQNLKNFIRHGKQARAAPPVADQSTVHAQPPQKQQQNYQYHALSDVTAAGYGGGPAAAALQQQQKKDFSVAGTGANDNRNLVARANDAAAAAAGQHQQHQQVQGSGDRKADYDPSVLERIVAEERESKGKLPQYPGLDRWTLVEKMGDGAFSNVYRARDNTGRHAEVAIKVVRKYEMGSTQVSPVSVCRWPCAVPHFLFHSTLWRSR